MLERLRLLATRSHFHMLTSITNSIEWKKEKRRNETKRNAKKEIESVREHIGRNLAVAHSIYILIYENVHGIQFPAAIRNTHTHIFDSSSAAATVAAAAAAALSSSWACWEQKDQEN